MALVSRNGDIDCSRNSCGGGKRGGMRNMNARCVISTGGRLPKPGSTDPGHCLRFRG